jgi:hypothetical protein
MKILLQHGFCHIVIVDADSKFKAAFQETMELLQINMHMASGNNHDSILVERFNAFLNKGLKVLCTDRSTSRVFKESAQLLTYAWNSAPMAETDISRSLVAMGREYSFPIDFIDTIAPSLDLSPNAKISYANDLKQRLKACQEVYKVLIEEHRCMHREYINARRPNPTLYEVGDIVWARRQIKSIKKRGIIGKLRYKQTGLWKIIENLEGGSYKLQLCSNERKLDKKHASELSLFPSKLIPYPQLSGADEAYSKINKPTSDNPFSEAGLHGYEGYDLAEPWQIRNQYMSFAQHIPNLIFDVQPFPTVQELNDELFQITLSGSNKELVNTPPIDSSDYNNSTSINNVVASDQPTLVEDTNKHNQEYSLPTSISLLMSKIISSEDKLFFIRHKIPSLHRTEWCVVQVDFQQSLEKNPLALTNGRVLVKFLISHPKDILFNAPNQRFWTEYHQDNGLTNISHRYHLINPSKDEENYCKSNRLRAYSEWVNMYDPAVFIFRTV